MSIYINNAKFYTNGNTVVIDTLDVTSVPKEETEYTPIDKSGRYSHLLVADDVLTEARCLFRSLQASCRQPEECVHSIGTGFTGDLALEESMKGLLAGQGKAYMEICAIGTRDRICGPIKVHMTATVLCQSYGDGWSDLMWSHIGLRTDRLPKYRREGQIVSHNGHMNTVLWIDEEEGQAFSAQARWFTRGGSNEYEYDEKIVSEFHINWVEFVVCNKFDAAHVRAAWNLCHNAGIKTKIRREQRGRW